jgi:DNA-directed RNA polymerase beta' subunit
MPSGIIRPDSDIEPIVGIQFGIFSPEEIERRSVVEITNSGTYDGTEPRIGGLFDPRMGVLENGKTCRSCGQTNHGCPGHFGHYRLARPVYFIQFFQYTLNILKCVCVRCSKLLIDKSNNASLLKRRGEARWRAVLGLCGNVTRCGSESEDGCGARQPNKYTRDGIARIVAEWADINGPGVEGASAKQTQVLEVEYVLRLFRRITDDDVDFMGLSRYWCRPESMICTVLPIPPPQVRPSVIQDNNQRSEDDLTHKLSDIINTNNTLSDKINNNAAKNIVDDYTTVLQYHVATLVDNQIPGVAPSAQRSGRPLKSVQQRLGSKEGRIRYNIQGKRVEHSARSVITPDPNLSIGELGVPIKMAMNLTIPEKVTPYNIEYMYKLIQNGADKYPGAKTIQRADGRMISLKHVNTREIVLHQGDLVNRHLLDGDPVLFNRQPTLHRMSMMCHRVRVLPYNTFRLNVCVVSPYNADFDGDEMNAHIPQSYEAATELAEIAAVPMQIITPRHAKPVIGIVQDTLVGSYRITQPSVSFSRKEFMNMMMWNNRFEGVVPAGAKDGRWTGQQVISQLLPHVNIAMGNDQYNDNKIPDNYVVIREGVIQQGIIDKGIFAKPSKGIIHVAYNDFGPKETVNFIDSMQNTIEQFLIYNGFSVGISDMIADETTKQNMEDVIKKRKAEIEDIILQVHLDLFDNNTGKSNQEEFENKVFSAINKATDESGKIGLASLTDENRLVAMVRAGSKGSSINIAQMIACLGQQATEGKRIPYGFTDRTLPHYKKYDDGAEARGFIESSFIRGLTPQEFFFHAMSGREGLIDTAVKTADTGYIQRQLVKAMEDIVIQYDGTVRDARGKIMQFYYGEDGVNATKIESQSLGLTKLSETDIRKDYGSVGEGEQAVAEYVEQLLLDRQMLVEGVSKSRQDMNLFSPVNVERLIQNVAISFRFNEESVSDLTPGYVLQGIDKLIRRTQPYHRVWGALLRFHLAPHKMILKERFSRVAFDALCEIIVTRDWKSWAQPGEMVGIIAAQSIGEPSTQMTLNSVDWDTRILIAKDGEIQTPEIGAFVDSYYKNCDPAIVQTLPNGQIYIPLEDGHQWEAVSTDTTGKMQWTKLEAITRHPVVNEDGTDTILNVTLHSGRSVKATKGKSFLTMQNGEILPTDGADLKVGDSLPVAVSLAVDHILKNIPITEINNSLPVWLLQAPTTIVKSFVEAYVNSNAVINNEDIEIAFLKYDVLEKFAALLGRFGIFTTLTTTTITIPSQWVDIFYKNFAVTINTHTTSVNKDTTKSWEQTKDVVWDRIKTIEEVRPMGDGWVYDLTVAETRTFTGLNMMALNDTFHLAGVAAKSNVTRGVPRLKELLKVTHNPKATSLTVYLKPEFRESREMARSVAQDLELTLLRDITIKTAIYYDPNEEESILVEDRDLLTFYRAFEQEEMGIETDAVTAGGGAAADPQSEPKWSPLILRLELDREKLFIKNISMDDIAFVLRTKFGGTAINIVYSDYNSPRLVMRIRVPMEMDRDYDYLSNLKKLQNRILNGIVIRGVLGIKAANFRKDKDSMELIDGTYKQVEQYVLDTDGSNFMAVMNHPMVNGYLVTSSDVHDIYDNLGVEAARSTLIREMTTLFEEAGVNYRHLGLLCDVMTRAGSLMSIDRYGVNKSDIGPLAKASFEETDKILRRAAMFGEVDPVTGISAKIMTGQAINGGTGFFDILLDEAAFMRVQQGLAPVPDIEEEGVEEPTEEQIDAELFGNAEDLCSSTRLKMSMVIPNSGIAIDEPDVDIMILSTD